MSLLRPRSHDVGFQLAGIVRYVEQQLEVCIREEVVEDALAEVTKDFPVCQCTIDPGAHCSEVALSKLRLDGRTRQGPYSMKNHNQGDRHDAPSAMIHGWIKRRLSR